MSNLIALHRPNYTEFATERNDLVPDCVLQNCRMIDVYSQAIVPADIAIIGDSIVSNLVGQFPDAPRVYDCAGLFAAPGLIDPHMHVDTTFLWPGELARILVPLGTTTVVVDTLNIAHTGGTQAVNNLRKAFAGLPLRGIFSAPSYCPFNSDLETAAADMTTDEIIALLDDGCVSIGETVWSRVALEDAEYLRLIHACQERGLRVSGHGGELPRGDEGAFDAYVTAGMHDDHCLAQGMDLLPRLRRGLELFLVEASGRRDQLARLLDGARERQLENAFFTARSCLCVDNITVMDMVTGGYGYLDRLVRMGLAAGFDPATVFRMGALNPAEHYRLSHRLGSLAPGRAADILLMKAPDAFPPEKVFAGGKLVAEQGRLIVPIPEPRYPVECLHSLNVDRLTLAEFRVPTSQQNGTVRAHVITVQDGDAFNTDTPAVLPVRNGEILPRPAEDVLKLAVVERYGRSKAKEGVGVAFVRGMGLKRGAMATSVSVPSNNIVVVGVSDADMLYAVQALRSPEGDGGFVVVENGQVLARVALPVDGIMAMAPYETVVADLDRAQAVARELGCTLEHPLFTMAQTVLSTLPELGLTDKGLVNAREGRVIPAEIPSDVEEATA